MNKFLFFCISICIALQLPATPAFSAEKASRYVTLRYADKNILSDFNDQLLLSRGLRGNLQKKNMLTVADEVLAKADLIIEKTEIVLDMYPKNLHISLVLLPTSRDVSRMYKRKYGKDVNLIAYYSLSEKTIYISVDDTKLRVLAHEVGHAVVDHYFKVRPPYNIHELMAQFAEKHITD